MENPKSVIIFLSNLLTLVKRGVYIRRQGILLGKRGKGVSSAIRPNVFWLKVKEKIKPMFSRL